MLILLTDFGSTYTKLTLVDTEKHEIIATAISYTTVETNILIGYEDAFDKLNYQGKIDKKYACSSAAGGLVVTAIGLVKELTVEAAKRAALGAGAKVEYVYSNFLTEREIKEIRDSNTDIILLAGGTDGGNSECIIHNAKMLAEFEIDVPIVMAGNKHAQREIEEVFKAKNLYYRVASNVMPELNVLDVESAKEVIRNIFIETIIEAKGIKEAEKLVDNVIMPTPAAVLYGLEILSKGTKNEKGIGDLICLDIGGATTDIHSVCDGFPTKSGVLLRGLEEPFAKRTVEGDLGMRYSANSLLKAVGRVGFQEYQVEDVEQMIMYRKNNPEFIAKTKQDIDFDIAMASICADFGMSRHVGKIETEYTPMGNMYYQVGKDLSKVKNIIATGGIAIKYPSIVNKILVDKRKLNELRPEKAKILVDEDYVFAALGLLAVKYPDDALKIMKKYLKVEEL